MVTIVASKKIAVTPQNAEEIGRLAAAGFTLSVEANGHAVKRPSGQRVHRKIKRRVRAIPANHLKEMVALRQKGMRLRIIARRYGLSVSGAGNAIRRVTKGGAA